MSFNSVETEFFYNKNVSFCYVLNLRITFVLCAILHPLISIIVIKHSKGMKIYKWFILYNITAAFILNTCLMIVSPIPLFPVLAFYSENIFHTSNLFFLQMAFPIVITSVISLSLGICSSTSYRYFKILPKWGPLILQRWKWLAAFILCFYFSIASLFYILQQYLIVDPIIIAQQLSDIPSLLPLVKEKTMLLKMNTRFTITIIAFIQTFAPFGFGAMLIHMYLLIKKRKLVSSKNTYNLQITLYWYMVFECLIIYFILIVPFSASLLIAVFKIPYGGPISTVLFTIISWHCVVEYGILLYLIKPYRRALQKYVKKLKLKIRSKKPHAMITVWFTSGVK